MNTPQAIRYYHRGRVEEVRDAAPTRTVLQHLREDRHCTGTKEGCAEGDCGACTVVVGSLEDGKLALQAVNACIQLLPSLDGKALFTVEDVALPDGRLHPVQQALVDCHGSQCGFCTPGFVMSLWAMYQQQAGACPSRAEIDDALSGNLCRCTGYRPIIDAAQRMVELPPAAFDAAAVVAALQPLQRTTQASFGNAAAVCHVPRTLAELVALRAAEPQAVLVAGSTDVGLWITKQMRELGNLILLGQVAELKRIQVAEGMLEIGAGATLNAAYAAVCEHYPELRELWQRFASRPIRNAGTLGGNVANGSPIGDSMPWLIALGAQVLLRGPAGQRVLALEDFYLGYQQKDLQAGEFVEAVRVPLPRAQRVLRTYKLAKRFDQDISAVCAAFALDFAGDTISAARIALGGMAATPKRAAATEAALVGQPWSEAVLARAMEALGEDYTPLSDMRASSSYRLTAARNLLRRFWFETRRENPLPADAVNAFAVRA
ncbi:xanthine dehydrogenase small subunit [Massilia sp. TS11]|uniref:xanthine dehydrogenase small subunit n=1 Tax=Massilia sp. TS11 TaxID=2908003 RepID=UPI001EDB6C97|nr:xanthine dehydrogenase small subunit [Massilia sp. TS11]MCG2586101.1 xanthine dehydrogenase small subunit [Massilia sp. TS11]